MNEQPKTFPDNFSDIADDAAPGYQQNDKRGLTLVLQNFGTETAKVFNHLVPVGT